LLHPLPLQSTPKQPTPPPDDVCATRTAKGKHHTSAKNELGNRAMLTPPPSAASGRSRLRRRSCADRVYLARLRIFLLLRLRRRMRFLRHLARIFCSHRTTGTQKAARETAVSNRAKRDEQQRRRQKCQPQARGREEEKEKSSCSRRNRGDATLGAQLSRSAVVRCAGRADGEGKAGAEETSCSRRRAHRMTAHAPFVTCIVSRSMMPRTEWPGCTASRGAPRRRDPPESSSCDWQRVPCLRRACAAQRCSGGGGGTARPNAH